MAYDAVYSARHYQAHREEKLLYQKEHRKKNRRAVWAYHTLEKHKHQGYEVRLTTEELTAVAAATETCFYCKCQLKWETGPYSANSPTLDRVSNERYLDSKNVRILCRTCNLSKQHRTHEQFVQFCTHMVERFGDPR